MLCCHCQSRQGNHHRRLCRPCYNKVDVRCLYPCVKPIRRGIDGGDHCATARTPQEKTDALPGSNAKIIVMMQRANRREDLFHPDDSIRIA